MTYTTIPYSFVRYAPIETRWGKDKRYLSLYNVADVNAISVKSNTKCEIINDQKVPRKYDILYNPNGKNIKLSVYNGKKLISGKPFLLKPHPPEIYVNPNQGLIKVKHVFQKDKLKFYSKTLDLSDYEQDYNEPNTYNIYFYPNSKSHQVQAYYNKKLIKNGKFKISPKPLNNVPYYSNYKYPSPPMMFSRPQNNYYGSQYSHSYPPHQNIYPQQIQPSPPPQHGGKSNYNEGQQGGNNTEHSKIEEYTPVENQLNLFADEGSNSTEQTEEVIEPNEVIPPQEGSSTPNHACETCEHCNHSREKTTDNPEKTEYRKGIAQESKPNLMSSNIEEKRMLSGKDDTNKVKTSENGKDNVKNGQPPFYSYPYHA